MMRFYLDEILDGSKSSDARLYPTDIRGRIALGDSTTNKVYALADLASCTPISYGEFVEWHRTGPFAYTEFAPYHAGRACYSYGLENVRKIPVPVKVPNPGGARVWLEVSEDVSKKFTAQRTLFRGPGTCGPGFAETFLSDFNRGLPRGSANAYSCSLVCGGWDAFRRFSLRFPQVNEVSGADNRGSPTYLSVRIVPGDRRRAFAGGQRWRRLE